MGSPWSGTMSHSALPVSATVLNEAGADGCVRLE